MPVGNIRVRDHSAISGKNGIEHPHTAESLPIPSSSDGSEGDRKTLTVI
jgi:hypothetical protein